MTSDLDGDDPGYDLTDEEKDRLEKPMREEARQLLRKGKARERRALIDRANEISRRKSKRAHQENA